MGGIHDALFQMEPAGRCHSLSVDWRHRFGRDGNDQDSYQSDYYQGHASAEDSSR